MCFVSPSLLLLFLTETSAAFLHIPYFANISTGNLKTKTLANTFGLCLRIIMTIPNWIQKTMANSLLYSGSFGWGRFQKQVGRNTGNYYLSKLNPRKQTVGGVCGFFLFVWLCFDWLGFSNGYSVLKWRNWGDNTWCCPAHLV